MSSAFNTVIEALFSVIKAIASDTPLSIFLILLVWWVVMEVRGP